MHEHSEKIEPKKVMVTVVLTILFFGLALYLRNNKDDSRKEPEINSDISTTTISKINNI